MRIKIFHEYQVKLSVQVQINRDRHQERHSNNQRLFNRTITRAFQPLTSQEKKLLAPVPSTPAPKLFETNLFMQLTREELVNTKAQLSGLFVRRTPERGGVRKAVELCRTSNISRNSLSLRRALHTHRGTPRGRGAGWRALELEPSRVGRDPAEPSPPACLPSPRSLRFSRRLILISSSRTRRALRATGRQSGPVPGARRGCSRPALSGQRPARPMPGGWRGEAPRSPG